eukprot:scaffold319684_cov44-Tisochrysis_lutea.AAC.1
MGFGDSGCGLVNVVPGKATPLHRRSVLSEVAAKRARVHGINMHLDCPRDNSPASPATPPT